MVSHSVLSRSVMSNSLPPHGLYPPDTSVHGDSPGKKTGVGCHFLLWSAISIWLLKILIKYTDHPRHHVNHFQEYISAGLSVFTLLCNQPPELSHLAKPKLWTHYATTFHLLLFPVPASLYQLFYFWFLITSFMWNHTVWNLIYVEISVESHIFHSG